MDSLTPSSLPLLSSLLSTFFLLLSFASSPLVRSIHLVNIEERLPDGTTQASGIGLWGGCISDGPCSFASPFPTSSHPSTFSLPSPKTLSAILPSQGWTVLLLSALLLAFLSSLAVHLLNSYLLYKTLSETPRSRMGHSNARQWSKIVSRFGAGACLSAVLILGISLLAPCYHLVLEYLDPDHLGGKEVDGGCLATPGIGSLLAVLGGGLILLGGKHSDRPSRLSFSSLKDLADEEEEVESPTTGAFILWTETRSEKPWVVLDVLMEEDEEDVDMRRTGLTYPRSRSPRPSVMFFLA